MADDTKTAVGVALAGGAAALLLGLFGRGKKPAAGSATPKLSGPPPARKGCGCGR